MLKGQVFGLNLETNFVTVDVQGVGYDVRVSNPVKAELMLGELTQFWISTHLSDDAIRLYGFLSQLEKDFFLNLLKVKGVGPSKAMDILSGGAPEQLIDWIDTGDVKSITSCQGIGKKTAEQVVLDLKGKLGALRSSFSVEVVTRVRTSGRSEILSALIHSGGQATWRSPRSRVVLGTSGLRENDARLYLRASTGR
jgi:Holliday junction DNA helicase RuvA